MYNNNKAYKGEDGGPTEHRWSSAQSLGLTHVHSNNIVFQQGRRRVEIVLIVLCAILLMACLILSILLALEITKEAQGPENANANLTAPQMCNTVDCLRIASEVKRNLNESVDPCNNFFHYACDGWIKENPIPPSETEFGTFFKLMLENAEIVRNLLNDFDTEVVRDPNDAVLKAVHYYKSCMNEDRVELTAKDQMLQLIQEFKLWAIDPEWNDTLWDKNEVLQDIQLYASTKRSPLFQVQVVEDFRNASKYLIKVSCIETEKK